MQSPLDELSGLSTSNPKVDSSLGFQKEYQRIRALIDRPLLKSLHRMDPLRSLSGIAMEWIGIIGAIWLTERFFSIPLYILSVLWISARITALGFIMHDAVHFLVLRNKRWNDIVSELFLAWPIFISLRSYRIKHLTHHRHLNTDRDPDWTAKSDPQWQFPQSKTKLTRLFLELATGLHTAQAYRSMSKALVAKNERRENSTLDSRRYSIFRIIYYSALFGVLYATGTIHLYALYWIVPILTWVQVLNRLRRISEHSAIYDRPLALQTRTTLHSPPERLFLSPRNVSFHNEHHLFPNVPYYRLPSLHRELMRHPLAQERLLVTRSYWGVLRDCRGQSLN
jgi:fatty acid desaturase